MSTAAKRRICVIGSGNWGTTVAMIVGGNALRLPDSFEREVRMWVFEETLDDGRKLTDVINAERENVKYLAGHKLPENVVAVADVAEAADGADVLIFVLPHQFIDRSLAPLRGRVKAGAVGISLVKGFSIVPSGGIRLVSSVIADILGGGLEVSVLMGANIASEVAAGNFCETTVGCRRVADHGPVFKAMFETPGFRVSVVDDVSTVEICGALKNVVACAAGFVDGLGLGDNTKAAAIRIGLMEMVKYCVEHHRDYGCESMPSLSTFFESCGVADLVTTCYAGRNRKVAEAFVRRKDGATIAQLEGEMLGGQKLQGPETAAEVNFVLAKAGIEDQFPLLTAVHKICAGEMPPEGLIERLADHPVHKQSTEAYTHIK